MAIYYICACLTVWFDFLGCAGCFCFVGHLWFSIRSNTGNLHSLLDVKFYATLL